MFANSQDIPKAPEPARWDGVLDRLDDAIGAVEDFVLPKIEFARRARRAWHLRATRNAVRAAVDRSFLHDHAQRARLLDLWAHLEDALHLSTLADGIDEPVSPAGRVLRIAGQMERFYGGQTTAPWNPNRPRFASDIETVGAAHLDELAASYYSSDRRKGAASKLRDVLHPVVGCYAASTLRTVYQLERGCQA